MRPLRVALAPPNVLWQDSMIWPLRFLSMDEFRKPRSNDREPRQPLHLTDERSYDRHPYYMQDSYDDLPQNNYVSNRRSSSAPAQQYWHQQRQQGFVEPEDMYDPRQPQRGNGGRGDMINSLAQQAISMGLGGGKKDKNGNGEFLSSLMKK